MVLSYFYHEPIKGDVHRFKVLDIDSDWVYICSTVDESHSLRIPNKVYPDGSYFLQGSGSFYPETKEWKDKYQESLSLRVAQDQMVVYFVTAVKRGKVNTRAMVIADNGACYLTYVPTIPAPRFGESYLRLRMDLEVVSLFPVNDLLSKVKFAREADPTLL